MIFHRLVDPPSSIWSSWWVTSSVDARHFRFILCWTFSLESETGHVSTGCEILLFSPSAYNFPVILTRPGISRLSGELHFVRQKSRQTLKFNCATTHTADAPFWWFDRSSSFMMMTMCLESNRHGNVATVGDAAAMPQIGESGKHIWHIFPLLRGNLISLRRTRPVPTSMRRGSFFLVWTCLNVLFFFLSANDYDVRRLKEIGAFKVFRCWFFFVGKCKPVRSFFVHSFWREIFRRENWNSWRRKPNESELNCDLFWRYFALRMVICAPWGQK